MPNPEDPCIWGHAERRRNNAFPLRCRASCSEGASTATSAASSAANEMNRSAMTIVDDFSDDGVSEYDLVFTVDGDDAEGEELPGAYAITPASLEDLCYDDEHHQNHRMPVEHQDDVLNEQRPKSWCMNTRFTAAVFVLCIVIATTLVIVDSRLDSNEQNNPSVLPINEDYYLDPFWQCRKYQQIRIVSENMRENYLALKTSFSVPLQNYIRDNEKGMQSCTPVTAALMWTALDDHGDGGGRHSSMMLQGRSLSKAETRFVLVLIHASMGGENWKVQTNWLSHADAECSWHGVQCDDDENLIGLDLSDNHLNGSMGYKFGLLSNLRALNASYNSIQGTIPFDSFSAIETLDLKNNNLTGRLPATLGALNIAPYLAFLLVSSNSISGPIPDLSGLVNLVSLDISDTALTGTFPLKGLEKLTNLEHLVLARSASSIQGTMSSSLTALTNLKVFLAANTYLYGTIPESIGNMTSLEHFIVTAAQLSGTIPTTFGLLNNLVDLVLNANKLVGSIPSELGKCSNLRVFDATENFALTGTLPSDMARCTALKEFEVELTSISGTVPQEFEDMKQLETLIIACSAIQGPLPIGLCGNSSAQIFADKGQEGFLNCPCCVPTQSVCI